MLNQRFTKANKFLECLRLEFPKKDMEKEYKSLQEENKVKDFKVCLEFLIFLNLVVTIISVTTHSWVDAYYAAGPVILLIPVYCLRRYLAKYIQVVTLIIILTYNISRLLLLESYFKHLSEGRLFYAGFSMAILQSVLFVRLVKISHKLFAILAMLALRFVIVSAYIDTESFSVSAFIRHLLIDSYLFYTLYSQEVNYRKIYRSFVNKKEELLKFKELLDESLPQSLAVFSEKGNELLFANKAFQNAFITLQSTESTFPVSEDTMLKISLESLLIDQSTVHDTAFNFTSFLLLNGCKDLLPFTEFLKKITSTDDLNNRAISLSACTKQNNARKLFEVTFKKVDWDSKDAVAVIFNDITYQESLIALKLANINKDKIIATVSHELRTPLNGIIGILEITEKEVDNPKVGEHLSLCKDNAHLLLNLVNSILDFQQISSGKLKLNRAKIDIHQVLHSVVKLFDFQCNEKNISLRYDIQTNVPRSIFTDQNRLKQVLINLVGNAIKFTFKGGIKIQVTTHQEDAKRLKISVMDTGIGIKHEDQKSLFKLYSKLENGESVNKNGVGLGLTISNALALILNGGLEGEGHGIRVDSEYGIGATFCFEILKELQFDSIEDGINRRRRTSIQGVSTHHDTTSGFLNPKVNMDEDQKAEEEYLKIEDNAANDFVEFSVPDNRESKLSNHATPKFMCLFNLFRNGIENIQVIETSPQKKYSLKAPACSLSVQKQLSPGVQVKSDLDILVVDDNPFNLLVAKNLLKDFGYNVQTALGGPEAIDITKKSFSQGIIFKVIFMDCQMPIMDGFETTKALRALMESGEIREAPIIAWTANNSEEDVKRCYEVGMVGHLSKPTTKADISKVLSRLP